METKVNIIQSSFLKRDIKINIYGHYGLVILIFPALNGKSIEFEQNGGLAAVENLVKIGKCKVFSIDTLDSEYWYDAEVSPKAKSEFLYNFNKFVEEELVEYVFMNCGGAVPIVTAGAGFGAYLAVNTFFRRPDLFFGTIGISGTYDLSTITKDYFDENCYYNSPVHYLPNLNDSYWLSYIYSRRHIYLACGRGEGEIPYHTENMGRILADKNIRYQVEIYDENYKHDYKTWIELFKHFIDTKL
ncbi:alpha/beta hydrolase-fold protein [Candidatus Kapaibacterium sp.]